MVKQLAQRDNIYIYKLFSAARKWGCKVKVSQIHILVGSVRGQATLLWPAQTSHEPDEAQAGVWWPDVQSGILPPTTPR